tara:strand:- start:5270 stop:5566 length:297 start_codon:yes stop_codon:yes gene_type:complete
MAQDPRKLRKLLDILTQFGVTKYKSEDVEIELVNPVTLAQRLHQNSQDNVLSVANDGFSMDNYDKEQTVDTEDTETKRAPKESYLGYSDDEILNWSAG